MDWLTSDSSTTFSGFVSLLKDNEYHFTDRVRLLDIRGSHNKRLNQIANRPATQRGGLRFEGSSSSGVNSDILSAITVQFGNHLCEYSLQSANNLVEEY